MVVFLLIHVGERATSLHVPVELTDVLRARAGAARVLGAPSLGLLLGPIYSLEVVSPLAATGAGIHLSSLNFGLPFLFSLARRARCLPLTRAIIVVGGHVGGDLSLS
jgi:hypothetical protein